MHCSECKKEFEHTATSGPRKTCSDECAKARKKRLHGCVTRKSLEKKKCIICCTLFAPLCSTQTVCYDEACKREQKRRLNALRRPTRGRLRIREEAKTANLVPTRKCHDCGKVTWNYRCDKCRAKWRARNGADALYGLADLFTGGHCYADVPA